MAAPPALKTPASLRNFESLNRFIFNAEEEASLHDSRISSISFELHQVAEEFFKRACSNINGGVYSPLCDVMIANRCNKPIAHNYTQIYHQLLDGVRNSELQLAEIGIGTPNQDVPSAMASTYIFGSSLRGWREYLPNTVIRGGDIDPRVLISEDRIQTAYLNQLSPVSISRFHAALEFDRNGLDFFLDDGLHEFRSNITLLLLTWPHIKANGLYLIEDISPTVYLNLIDILSKLSLNAVGVGFELPSTIKADNRIIVLQKLG